MFWSAYSHKTHQDTEPDRIGFARTRGGVQQSGLALSHRLADIALKFERLPAALVKPGVEFGFDGAWARFNARAGHGLMVMLHPVLRRFTMKSRFFSLLLVCVTLTLSGCGYNQFQALDEQTKSAWAEVLNQYQRRADLVPNIVATVKGEAAFEQDTLTKVVEARAKATSIQVTPETLNNPEAFKKFQAAQGELSGALSRLLVVSENYPNLKANQGFQDLRVQLEGTENRITVARNRYIKTVQDYNILARSFPNNLTAMVFSYSVKPNLTVENEAQISKPPAVSFEKK
jgi:LemA protein